MKGIRNFCVKQVVPMSNRIKSKLISNRSHFKCEMCGKLKMAKMYEYQAIAIVPRYKPEHFKKVCGNCIYKETYGTNYYKAKKKEGVLDSDLRSM